MPKFGEILVSVIPNGREAKTSNRFLVEHALNSFSNSALWVAGATRLAKWGMESYNEDKIAKASLMALAASGAAVVACCELSACADFASAIVIGKDSDEN
jgi:hypothetical protein